ncbi:MAG: sugar phosphate isomerase/epimerase [Asgard group archaeon]|nr:sugar phosphate isomerase/epimerase [Asgard group archaeon]
MKIGASFVQGFIGISKIENFLQFAYQKEFDVVELVAEPMLCFVDDFNKQNRKQISKLASDLQIELTLHATFSDTNIAALNPHVREANNLIIKKSIQFAADLNAQIVTIHPGTPGVGGIYYSKEVKQNHKTSIIDLTKYAQEKQVKIGYENFPVMPWNLFEESFLPEPIRKFISDINLPNLGITWDIGHSNTTDLPLKDFYENFKNNLHHLHFHDNDGPIGSWTDTHTPVGSGTVDWEELMLLLKKMNYQKTCVLELNTIEKIEQSMDYLSQYL